MTNETKYTPTLTDEQQYDTMIEYGLSPNAWDALTASAKHALHHRKTCVNTHRKDLEMSPIELRKLRLKLDLTQEQMADKLYMSTAMYGCNERGINPISKRTERLYSELLITLADA